MSFLASGGGPTVTVIRWSARALALPVFAMWGMFFVAHLMEWFSNPSKLPPPWVFGMMALHLGILVGLVVGWRWETVGAVVSIVCAAVFFHDAARPRDVWTFTIGTSLPGLLWLLCVALTTLNGGVAKPAAPVAP
jgi:hypothetical protein